jgi:hypothetical protein
VWNAVDELWRRRVELLLHGADFGLRAAMAERAVLFVLLRSFGQIVCRELRRVFHVGLVLVCIDVHRAPGQRPLQPARRMVSADRIKAEVRHGEHAAREHEEGQENAGNESSHAAILPLRHAAAGIVGRVP